MAVGDVQWLLGSVEVDASFHVDPGSWSLSVLNFRRLVMSSEVSVQHMINCLTLSLHIFVVSEGKGAESRQGGPCF